MRTRWRARIAGGAVALSLASCGGSGEGLDAGGRPLAPDASGDGPPNASFASIQARVFTPICTVCHAGALAPQGLRLDVANSYDALVGVASSEAGPRLRVSPGKPDESYLVDKLEGHASAGARMPLGGPYLDATTIGLIRQWITDGAPRAPATKDAPAPASTPNPA